jgi:hypothetical protein
VSIESSVNCNKHSRKEEEEEDRGRRLYYLDSGSWLGVSFAKGDGGVLKEEAKEETGGRCCYQTREKQVRK